MGELWKFSKKVSKKVPSGGKSESYEVRCHRIVCRIIFINRKSGFREEEKHILVKLILHSESKTD